jgi:hypothetical protein
LSGSAVAGCYFGIGFSRIVVRNDGIAEPCSSSYSHYKHRGKPVPYRFANLFIKARVDVVPQMLFWWRKFIVK